MTTKYFVHGGEAQKDDPRNDVFFREALVGAPDKAKVLLVYFASEPERLERNKSQDIPHFENNKGDKILKFEIADPERFTEQVKDANVIYVRGGRTATLIEALKKYEGLNGLFAGKIVVAESAGANVLAKYCYSPTAGKVLEGFGLLPIKLIPHYVPEFAHKLDEVGPDLELVTLPEYEYRVFDVA